MATSTPADPPIGLTKFTSTRLTNKFATIRALVGDAIKDTKTKQAVLGKLDLWALAFSDHEHMLTMENQELKIVLQKDRQELTTAHAIAEEAEELSCVSRSSSPTSTDSLGVLRELHDEQTAHAQTKISHARLQRKYTTLKSDLHALSQAAHQTDKMLADVTEEKTRMRSMLYTVDRKNTAESPPCAMSSPTVDPLAAVTTERETNLRKVIAQLRQEIGILRTRALSAEQHNLSDDLHATSQRDQVAELQEQVEHITSLAIRTSRRLVRLVDSGDPANAEARPDEATNAEIIKLAANPSFTLTKKSSGHENYGTCEGEALLHRVTNHADQLQAAIHEADVMCGGNKFVTTAGKTLQRLAVLAKHKLTVTEADDPSVVATMTSQSESEPADQ